MQLISANHNVIASNVIDDNDPPEGVAGPGLLLKNSDDNTISSNKFSRNGGGVYIQPAGGSHNTIRGNTFEDTRGSPSIIVMDNNNTIQSNRLTGTKSGIALQDASGNFVYRNRALDLLTRIVITTPERITSSRPTAKMMARVRAVSSKSRAVRLF